jgi:hypothetical protein
VVELKASELALGLEFDSDIDKRKSIIDVEPSVTVTTTKVHLEKPEEPEESECLFHS